MESRNDRRIHLYIHSRNTRAKHHKEKTATTDTPPPASPCVVTKSFCPLQKPNFFPEIIHRKQRTRRWRKRRSAIASKRGVGVFPLQNEATKTKLKLGQKLAGAETHTRPQRKWELKPQVSITVDLLP